MSAPTRTNSALTWIGRVLSLLLVAVFILTAVMKLQHGEEMVEGIQKNGFDPAILTPLGILELTCAIIYLIPQTAIVGAILLTGYMGGAICTSWRGNETMIPQIIIGVLVWLAVFFRDRRLWSLIPFRTFPTSEVEK